MSGMLFLYNSRHLELRSFDLQSSSALTHSTSERSAGTTVCCPSLTFVSLIHTYICRAVPAGAIGIRRVRNARRTNRVSASASASPVGFLSTAYTHTMRSSCQIRKIRCVPSRYQFAGAHASGLDRSVREPKIRAPFVVRFDTSHLLRVRVYHDTGAAYVHSAQNRISRDDRSATQAG